MNPPLRDWKIDSKSEPMVRIGVVLEEDAIHSIDLQPDQKTKLQFKHVDDEVFTISLNGGAAKPASEWHSAPAEPTTPARGTGTLVKGIVAGRGFHWQKRVDQTLAGNIEILP